MRQHDVVLVALPDTLASRRGSSLGLGYLAATLVANGFGARVLNWQGGESLPQLTAEDLLVGVSVMFTAQIPEALRLSQALKLAHPQAHVTLGGNGVSFQWRTLLQEHQFLDSVAQFEGEATLLELARAIYSGVTIQSIAGLWTRGGDGSAPTCVARPAETNLDTLPFPVRDLAAMHDTHHASVVSSRGCAAHCTFCQSGNFGNRAPNSTKWRPRSPENVFDELAALQEIHGVDRISFIDDSFLGGDARGVARAHRLCELIIQSALRLNFAIECRADEVDEGLFKKLALAGLKHVFLGVESASPSELLLYGKKESIEQIDGAIALLRAQHITLSIGFIMFQPMSTLVTVRGNLEFLRRQQLVTPGRITNALKLYHGSPLLKYYRRNGIAITDSHYQISWDFNRPELARIAARFVDIADPYVESVTTLERQRFQRQVMGEPIIETEAHLRSLSDELSEKAMAVLDSMSGD